VFTLGVEIVDYQSESTTKQNNKLISNIQYHSKMVVGLFEGQIAFMYMDGRTHRRVDNLRVLL
jgi:hypothetical protein